MKHSVLAFILAGIFVCCTSPIDPDSSKPEEEEDYSQETLYIFTSNGALNGERAQSLFPGEAFLTINRLSSGHISMHIAYSWNRGGRTGFSADIPDLPISGPDDDFMIAEEAVTAQCNMECGRRVDWKEMTLNLKGYYKRISGTVSFNLVLTPSDNRAFPSLEIIKTTHSQIKLEEAGVEVDFAFDNFVFNNQLDTPVTVRWEAYPGEVTIAAHSSESVWGDEEYDIPKLFSTATLLMDGKEVETDLFAEGQYSAQKEHQYHIECGVLCLHEYTLYTFNITPAVFPDPPEE